MKIPKQIFLFALLTTIVTLAQAGENPDRTITTTGIGVVQAQADSILVTMQTTSTRKSPREAKRVVDDRINAFLEQVEKDGIQKEKIVASGIRINPQYDYSNRERVFAGFTASRDIRVELSEPDQLNAVLEIAVSTGIENINQITPQNSDEDGFRQAAFEAAIADSKARAAALAKAYGAELGAIHSISYQNREPITQPKMEMASLRAAQDGGGQYLHDEITYRDEVQVVFDILIPR
jgi:uncharacterized protein